MTSARGVLSDLGFLLLRTALKNRPKRPPTTNRRQPPAATTSDNQLPATVTNGQSPTTNRQSPPTVVEYMSYTRSFCKTAVQEHFLCPSHKDPRDQCISQFGALC